MIDMKFLLAGKAVFTADNGRGDHFTFKIIKKDAVCFAYVLSHGYENYTYMGLLDTEEFVLIRGKKGIDKSSKSVKVLEWSIKVIRGLSKLPEGYSIMHTGICGKCSRPLSDPESIKTGLGPTCRKM